MTWKEGWESFPEFSTDKIQLPRLRPFRINKRCFIREGHKCGKVLNASKSCFVACPDEEDLEPILELISEKLAKVGIEAIIAVKERAYGQDIFCTKICGKIIESKFCLIILDDIVDEGKNIPNPNVYYEYGLMTGLEKHVIPLQKEDLKLAFNIQSHDTIKYTPKNIGTELDRAIKDAIKFSEGKDKDEKGPTILPEKTILRNFEKSGFRIRSDDKKWALTEVLEDTGFKGLGHYYERFYLYLGKLDNVEEIPSYLEDLDIVLYRTEKKVKLTEDEIKNFKFKIGNYTLEDYPEKGIAVVNLSDRLKDYKKSKPLKLKNLEEELIKKEGFSEFAKKIYIGFIINFEGDFSEFIKKAEDMVSKYGRFQLMYSKEGEIEFGDVKVMLNRPNLI